MGYPYFRKPPCGAYQNMLSYGGLPSTIWDFLIHTLGKQAAKKVEVIFPERELRTKWLRAWFFLGGLWSTILSDGIWWLSTYPRRQNANNKQLERLRPKQLKSPLLWRNWNLQHLKVPCVVLKGALSRIRLQDTLFKRYNCWDSPFHPSILSIHPFAQVVCSIEQFDPRMLMKEPGRHGC